METVFTNADFISLDEHNNTYSVMVVKGKNIVYMGYSVPLAYDDAKIVDLGGRAVLPLVNDKMCLTYRNNAECTKLEAGQSADFAVVDKNGRTLVKFEPTYNMLTSLQQYARSKVHIYE